MVELCPRVQVVKLDTADFCLRARSDTKDTWRAPTRPRSFEPYGAHGIEPSGAHLYRKGTPASQPLVDTEFDITRGKAIVLGNKPIVSERPVVDLVMIFVHHFAASQACLLCVCKDTNGEQVH